MATTVLDPPISAATWVQRLTAYKQYTTSLLIHILSNHRLNFFLPYRVGGFEVVDGNG